MSDRELSIQSATADFYAGVFKSKNAAADAYRIPRTTFKMRLNGQQRALHSHEHEQRLAPNQENFLRDWILEEDSRGYPPSHARCREMASRILRMNGDEKPLGKNWVTAYLTRHPDIATRVGRKLEARRTEYATKEEVIAFLTRYETLRKQYNIQLDDIYNMDEQGIGLGVCSNSKVLTSSKKKRTLQKTPETREWVSIIEAISATGRVINPLVIFKGQNLQTDWFTPNEIPDWQYTTSERGWTSNEIGLGWLQRVFNPQTRPVHGGWRMLILDGHGSHIDLDFLFTCKTVLNIALVFPPPHTTHILQPLDLTAFSPVKTCYRSQISQLAAIDDAAPIKKSRFIQYYYQARQEGLITKNILSGWRSAGLQPYNPDKPLSSRFIKLTQPTATSTIQINSPQVKHSRALSFTTPTKEQELIRAARSFRTLHPRARAVIYKAGKAIGRANTQAAVLAKSNEDLQRKLNEVIKKPKKKAIRIDPNLQFADIESIKKAIEDAKVVEANSSAKQPPKTVKPTSSNAATPAFESMCSIIEF